MKYLYYLLLFFLLIRISLVDYKTYRIPLKYNVILGVMGVSRLIYLRENPVEYVVSSIFMICILGGLYLLSSGEMIGGGDVKLMAAAGLLLGFQKVIWSLFLGCFFALLIQGILCLKDCKSKVFPMGPYLCIGILCQIVAVKF